MSEWSNEHDWKSCDVKASAGSNPVLCARWSDSIFTHRNFKRNCNSELIIGRSIFPTSTFVLWEPYILMNVKLHYQAVASLIPLRILRHLWELYIINRPFVKLLRNYWPIRRSFFYSHFEIRPVKVQTFCIFILIVEKLRLKQIFKLNDNFLWNIFILLFEIFICGKIILW